MGQGSVWRSREAARSLHWEGRGQDLSPNLAQGEPYKPQTGVCRDMHRGAKCGEK